MQRRAQLLNAIEEFLYEVCLLTVFYPWYVLRLIFRPLQTMTEYRDAELGEREDELVVSPPLFLLITAAITTLLFPPMDLGNQRLFTSMTRLFSSDATIGRIGATVVPILLLAICSALVIEWRTPGGVSRSSFRLPLFLSVMVASVLLMVTAMLSAILGGADQIQVGLDRALGGLLVLAVGLVWFVHAQSLAFQLTTGCGRWMGIGYTLMALAANEAITSLLPKG